ncbi:hypothetical protein G9A89_003363 [Geosiphon pyriformis]|nr:hypothetical protein G9A89_003363 [Geosiphon pyriformis]
MNNNHINHQARLSRHASGILPSKQFFAPRKPILHSSSSIRRKSVYSVNNFNNKQNVSGPSTEPIPPLLTPVGVLPQESSNSIIERNQNNNNSGIQDPRPSITVSIPTLNSITNSANDSPISMNHHNHPLQSFEEYIALQKDAEEREEVARLQKRAQMFILAQKQQQGRFSEDGNSQLSPSDNEVIINISSNSSSISRNDVEVNKKRDRSQPLENGSIQNIDTKYSNTILGGKNPISKNLSEKTPGQQIASPYATISKYFPAITFQPATPPRENSHGRKRMYQLWPGRNRFYFSGRIMTSRDSPAFLVAILALIVPCCLFLIFSGPFLYQNVSPIVTGAFIYLFLLALMSMLLTSWSDPGIIPRNLDPGPEMDIYDNTVNASQGPYNFPLHRFPYPKDVKMNGVRLILKYCETCRIYRPPRCSHCRQCDNCVEGEDHHCIWLNNCIGRRNYRPFYTLIVTATILCLYVQVFSILHIVLIMRKNKLGILQGMMQVPISCVLALVAFFLMWSVGGLTSFHTYLICKNMTTQEQLRTNLEKRNGLVRNPYDFKRIYFNCCWVLCRPLVHSTVKRRAFIGSPIDPTDIDLHLDSDPEDQDLAGSRRSKRPQQIQMTTTTTTTTESNATIESNLSGETCNPTGESNATGENITTRESNATGENITTGESNATGENITTGESNAMGENVTTGEINSIEENNINGEIDATNESSTTIVMIENYGTEKDLTSMNAIEEKNVTRKNVATEESDTIIENDLV